MAGPVVRVPPANKPGSGTPTLAAAPIWTKVLEPSTAQYRAAWTLLPVLTGSPVCPLVTWHELLIIEANRAGGGVGVNGAQPVNAREKTSTPSFMALVRCEMSCFIDCSFRHQGWIT